MPLSNQSKNCVILVKTLSLLADKVFRQEARLGDHITFKQIRLVSYLHKLRQAMQQQQQQEQQQRVVFLASETSGSQAPLHTQPKQQQHQQQQEELDEQRGRPGDHLSAEQLRLEQQGRAAGMVEEWPGKNPSKPHVRLKARRVRRA
eukprot:1160044-Pelagomonas_calceolata.AAC.3